ncbi:hypothetical protein ABRZ88_02450 [Vibrio vulnificus]|uniref:hypothetical protein n=1 Tax=Vibrio vulnificus TaxID=672 RepID=UPI0021DB52CB
MTTRCISTFLENMDHEFSEIDTPLTMQGFKVDGDFGIKPFCELRELKSVDYFFLSSTSNFIFYEFSDLPMQRMKLDKISRNITRDKDNLITKKELAEVRKNIRAEIQKELVKKFNDTCLINTRMRDSLTNIPPEFNQLPNYAVVVPPLNLEARDSVTIDTVRFLDVLKGTLRNSIPKAICGNVKVVPLNCVS